MMNVQAEKIQQTQDLGYRGLALGGIIKRVIGAGGALIAKTLLAPHPKATARHDLETWARIEGVHPAEVHRFEFQGREGR